MANYGDLAERLSAQQEQEQTFPALPDDRHCTAAEIFEQLKGYVAQEIEKANVELGKRKLPALERQFLPSYGGKICLTFGPYLLGLVDFNAARGHVTAILAGPPNATEIARKDFPLDDEKSPAPIAEAIVSGLLMGRF